MNSSENTDSEVTCRSDLRKSVPQDLPSTKTKAVAQHEYRKRKNFDGEISNSGIFFSVENNFCKCDSNDEDEFSSESSYVPSSDDTTDDSDNTSFEHNLEDINKDTNSKKNKDLLPKRNVQKLNLVACTNDLPTTGLVGIENTATSKISVVSVFEEHPETVIINAALKIDGKRVRDKRHSCYYCQKQLINISKHLRLMHSNEIEITQLLVMPKNSELRKTSFSEIIRAGDFFHNCNVRFLKRGELILVRRPTQNEIKLLDYSDYGPCPYCLGYLLKKHLWHHTKFSCTKKRTDYEIKLSRHIIAESNAILNNIFNVEFTADFNKHVAANLRNDKIGKYCQVDNLILRFGSMQFEKYGVTQCEMIRQSMRQLARLTLKLKQSYTQNVNLQYFLVPERFDEIIKNTKLLCRAMKSNLTKRSEFEIPSLALKLGNALKKCTNLERGIALRKGDFNKNNMLLSFLTLLDREWCTRISSKALATLSNRKLNDAELLQITSDLKKLGEYIDRETTLAKNSINDNFNLQNWSRLALLTLSAIVLFNKRRSGEVSRITINQYNSSHVCQAESKQEMQLCSYETKLAEKLSVVIVVGKRNQKVPVILTASAKAAIDLLLSVRDKCGVNVLNPYIFASGQSLSNLRGHDCLTKIISELDRELEQPKYVNGTKLRKYVATVFQMLALSESECDWLAKHLGRDIKICSLHEDAVELTKISRILMAVDNGEECKIKEKSLEEIHVEELPTLEEDSDEDCDSSSGSEDSHDEVQTDVNSSTSHIKKCRIAKSSKEKKAKFVKKGIRQRWKTEEHEAVYRYFKTHIKEKIVPKKHECDNFLSEHASLSYRKWSDIKFCVVNQTKKFIKNKG